MYTRKAVVLAKLESVYGADPGPTPLDDAILTSRPSIKVLSDKTERNVVSSTLSPLAPQVVGRTVEIEFEVEARGSSAAGAPPEIGPLLRSCGLSETIDPGVSVAYRPVSGSFESCTLMVFLDGIRHQAAGCRGSVKFQAEAGRYGIYTFTMRGLYADPVDQPLPSPVYSGLLPGIVGSASVAMTPVAPWTPGAGKVHTAPGGSTTVTTSGDAFSIIDRGDLIKAGGATRTVLEKLDANTLKIDSAVDWSAGGAGCDWEFKDSHLPATAKVEFDLRNNLFRRDDVSRADGVAEIVIAERKTGGAIEPEAVLLAEKDFWAEFKNRTPNTLTFAYGARGSERAITFTAPRGVYDDVAYGDKGPILSYRIPFVCQYESGDDELSVVYR